MISVGIDIGSFSIKMAEASQDAKGFRIRRLDEFALSQDPNKDRQIEVIEILRQIAARYEPGTTRFVVAVGQGQVSLRHLEFPFRERHKILKSLPFELEEDIPLSVDDAIYDARVLKYIGAMTDVLAVACPKHHVEIVLQQARDGGIEADIVSVKGMAEANLFEPWVEAPPTDSTKLTPVDSDLGEESPAPQTLNGELVLDLGHATTTAVVLREGRLIDARHVDWGGKDIALAIAKQYSMHFTEALKQLQTKAFLLLNTEDATREQVEFSNLIKIEVKKLTHQLNLLMLEFRAQHNIEFQRVTLVGGLSRLKNLGAILTQDLDVPSNRLGGLAEHSHLDFQNNPHNEIGSICAIGLAAEGLKRPKNPAINLRKGEFAKQSQSFKVWWEKWSHSVYVGATAYVLFLMFVITRSFWAESMADKAHDVMAEQAKVVANIKPTKATPRNIKKFIRQQKKTAQHADLIRNLQGMDSALDILEMVSAAAPAKEVFQMNIKKFSVNNRTVIIEGEGRPQKAIKDFEQGLTSVARKGLVKSISSEIKARSGYSPFAFQFSVDRNIGDKQ
ncbi:MAG: pilus assembly protein PilM [Pseudobdellovibrionaceae bacterium]|nr:MAG: pilus assembly protein PilM [Pseudobdellovibrionaceae bacterium]